MLMRLFKKYFSKNNGSLAVGQDVYVHPESALGANTKIGMGTNINGPAYITSSKDAPVTIGKNCAIAHNLRIRARNHYLGYINLQDKFQHRHNLPALDSFKGPLVIGNNVWIGDNVIILSGVRVGDGVVIGAGSIVTKDIASYSVVAGNPARLIRMRFSDNVVRQLKNITWWDWSEEKIQNNKAFFEIDFFKEPDINLDKYIDK
jgi:virginiamycin A acetyltransferase